MVLTLFPLVDNKYLSIGGIRVEAGNLKVCIKIVSAVLDLPANRHSIFSIFWVKTIALPLDSLLLLGVSAGPTFRPSRGHA